MSDAGKNKKAYIDVKAIQNALLRHFLLLEEEKAVVCFMIKDNAMKMLKIILVKDFK